MAAHATRMTLSGVATDEIRLKMPEERSKAIWEHLVAGIVGAKGPFSRLTCTVDLENLAQLGSKLFPYGPPCIDMMWGETRDSFQKDVTYLLSFFWSTNVFLR